MVYRLFSLSWISGRPSVGPLPRSVDGRMFELGRGVYASAMTRWKREAERTYETPAAHDASWLAALLDVEGIASVAERGTEKLDAVYYDTDDLRLVGTSATLRRRTGGADAGWRLELPMSGADREEVSAPPSKAVPNTLRDLVVSRVREAELRPVVRIRSTRRVRHLLDSAGTVRTAPRARRRPVAGVERHPYHRRPSADPGRPALTPLPGAVELLDRAGGAAPAGPEG
ncbi:CYTH domain-containing protein [Streptomyces sp. NPDC001914]|uniref:CYTH domain-containing protein n=1 Tax=Streptomyces sp. NPDC001914 TaxID=3364623 RepID=UPI0036785C3F